MSHRRVKAVGFDDDYDDDDYDEYEEEGGEQAGDGTSYTLGYFSIISTKCDAEELSAEDQGLPPPQFTFTGARI